ncbi:MAG: hypothetical protein QGI63_09655 [Rhodospirillales bacterium]|nr:hypothetical protein [Rhodospirillales bacterium]MDP6774525.1 hypothetical protein [Rhodospirillales bacterium]
MIKLSIWSTIRDSYAFVWRGRRRFLSLAAPAVVILAIASTLVAWLAVTPASADAENAMTGPAAVLLFLTMPVAVFLWLVFSVAWHRRFLVPGESVTVGAALGWSRRHSRFLLLSIAVGLLIALVMVGGALAAFAVSSLFGVGQEGLANDVFLPLYLVGLACALVISGRLALLFPAAAVDHRMTFGECWATTRGNGWRLAIILFLVAVPVWAVANLISAPIGYFGQSNSLTVILLAGLVDQTLGFVGVAVGVTALSIAYRAIMGAQGRVSITEE